MFPFQMHIRDVQENYGQIFYIENNLSTSKYYNNLFTFLNKMYK